MSGIEIIGVVLGVLPLIIAAVQRWGSTAQGLTEWKYLKQEYKKCLQDLKFAEVTLEANLENLLLPLIVDDDEIELLMQEPGGARWRNKHLENNLKRRLPRSYDLFAETVKQLSEVMSDIERELGFDRSGIKKGTMVCTTSSSFSSRASSSLIRSGIHDAMQRIMFAHSRDNRTRLFRELQQHNERLRSLLATQEEINTARERRGDRLSTKTSTALLEAWQHACLLYGLLNKAFRCKCRSAHELRLHLIHSSQVPVAEIHLNILYQSSNRTSTSLTPWSNKWCKAKALNTDNSVVDSKSAECLKRPWSSSARPMKSALRKNQSVPTDTRVWKGKVVQTEVLHPKESSSNAAAARATVGELNIKNLCYFLAGSIKQGGCIGYLRSLEAGFSIHISNQNTRAQPSGKTVTLGELLRRQCPGTLSRYQRYRIALALASSHLRFCSSPWINTWSKDALFFSPEQLTQPFIAHPVREMDLTAPMDQVSCGDPEQSSAKGKEREGSRAHRQLAAPALHTLGVVLTELCYGEAVEKQDFRQPAPLHHDSSPELEALLDITAARQWAYCVAEEAGERYAKAVDWCLRPRTHMDGAWRSEFWANVVEPLEWSVKQFEG